MIRRERYAFVKEKEGWQGAIDILTSHFFLATKSLLMINLKNFAAAVSEWKSDIREVFALALDLYGEIMLWPKNVAVYWPQSGATFYPTLMITEDVGERRSQVLATLFPGLMEKDAELINMIKAPPMDGLIFQSLALLQ
jgi:hypothetical protein